MTREEKIGYIRMIIEIYRDDGLERAEAAFRNCSEEVMKQFYGESGYTRQQVLDRYRIQRQYWVEAKDFFEELVK